MAIEALLFFGQRNYEFPGARIIRRDDDLDALTTEWQTERNDSFVPGYAPPGYPGMIIQAVETEEDYVGHSYLHRLNCLGVAGASAQKRTRFTRRHNSEGFDEAAEEWLTQAPNSHSLGNALSGFNNMFCTEVEKEEYKLGFYRVRKLFRGLLGSKDTKRRITVNEQIISRDSVEVDLPGGWSEAHRTQASLPKIVVEDSFVSLSPPPTGSIPGNSTPPNPPTITVLSVTGPDLLWHWPNGWKLASITSDQIPGANVWFIVLTYEYVWQKTF